MGKLEGYARLLRAVERYGEITRMNASPDGDMRGMTLRLDKSSSKPFERHPSLTTNYAYALSIDGNQATATAATVYGLLYAMETFAQLAHSGRIPNEKLFIEDAPDYPYRGLMLDAGRRFIPVPVVEDILSTMAANKLNVLHLHASDHCRFGVESKSFQISLRLLQATTQASIPKRTSPVLSRTQQIAALG